MFDQQLITTLQWYGLNTKQAIIYLTCLELGSSVAGRIATRSGENRATVYSVLKELTKQHIISQVTRKWVMYFSALSPELLAQRMEQDYLSFQSVVPDLLALSDQASIKPKVQSFEGIQGIKQMYETTLLYPWQDLYAFMNLAWAADAVVTWINDTYLDMRVSKKITAHVLITPASDDSQVYRVTTHTDDKLSKYSHYKTISDPVFTLENQINLIGGDTVLIYNFKPDELSGVIIQSKSYYQTMFSLFQYIWNQN